MSELFTQNYSDKPLFHTDTDISESLHNQVYEASNGEELLDNTEKQAESLLSNDDYVSETNNSISDDSDDVAESLSPPSEGNRKYITGTNTPRASRSNAYYELLCNQHTNGYRSPAMRGTAAAAHGITSAIGLVSYQEDFATDAAQDLGVHGAAAELIMQETFLGTAVEDVGILGSYAVKGIKDVQDGTRTAEEVLHTGGDVLRMELGSSAVQIGSAGARTALHYAESFSTSADDFADRAPGIISNTGFQAGHGVISVARFFAHPVKALVSIGRTALICGAIVLLLLIIGLLGQMGGTTTTSVLCADRPEDIQQLIESINTYRNEAATDELRRAFRNDVDPNGNPYGYDTLTGQRSNNMQHGVTWSYANGIYNDTAEIISMAAVYYQQDWPSSQELAAFTDDVPFTQYCRALTAYGMEITARESAPYSCISYGGCVNGYRSEGETVTITEYRCETHTCAQGNEECGHYHNGIWEWSDDHAEGSSHPEWIEDGTHDVTVFFPVIFPDGATQSELCALPDNYTQVVDGKIAAENCTGSIVLDESANLYKGELNDWFYAPNERTATFTVETTDGGETMTKDYTVTFANATAIPWCPGELHDGQYGHYDLNCTIYLTGYDRYADPETEAPNGADGGTGNLEALAESSNDGTLTRTVIKQDQYGNAYAGNAVTARFTKTITLPPGAAGFKGWYENGADTYGNVEWASLLYRMDWEALYGVADGIKCRSVGSALTADELQALLAGLNIDPDTARGQVVAFAISCQGHFVYGQPSSLRGGPGNASVGMNLDCSSFVQYCYWAQGLPFSAGNTAAYGRTGDLRAISPAEVQPGDLRVVYAAGGEQGHVQMALGGGAWIECCYGYGVCVNMSNAWMESRSCHYFTYAGF